MTKQHATAIAACLLLAATFGARAADDPALLQMASCEQSWLDFKHDPVKVQKYFGPFETQFRKAGRDGSFAPVAKATLFGHNIHSVYPQSVGMGLGYSVIIEAGFGAARAGMEKHLGKSLEHCGVDEGARSCEHRIAEKKTIVLMEAGRGNPPQTLVGCYYYYEQ